MHRTLALTCFLAAPIVAQHIHTPRSHARALPLAKEDGVFHFVIFGDRTGGPAKGIEVLRQAVTDTNLLGPDLVMTVGDLIQGYSTSNLWMKQMREFRGVMNGLDCKWFPVAGNHDVYWRNQPDKSEAKPGGEHEGNFEKHFGPLYYWFKHKNAAFFVLYTDEGDPMDGSKGFRLPRHTQMSKKQLDWLRAELAKVKDKDHVFVFCHHPRWIARTYPGSNWDDVHAILKDAGNVSAVFAGHIHRMRYSGKRDGIEYFALATTGGHKSMDLPGGGFVHHLNLVTVRKGRVTHATIPVGAVIDPKMMTDEHLAALDLLRRRMPTTTALEFDKRAGCMGVVEFEVENPTSRPIEVTATIEADDRLWAIGPDHAHAKIGPGKRKQLKFACAREPVGFSRLRAPQLSLQVDYLAKGLRVSLPARSRRLPVRLGELPAGFFDRLDSGALRTTSGSCLRVDSGELALHDGPFTVEAWMKAKKLDGRRALVAKTESCGFGIFVSNGQPTFDVHLDKNYDAVRGKEGMLEVGKWYHVAGVFDGSECRLYLNGQLVAKKARSGSRTRRNNPLYIGADPNRDGRPVSFFDGWIDEVRVSRVARYDSDFRPVLRHEVDRDTALLLHLDKVLGPFVPDRSRNGAHAARVGSVRCVHIERGSKAQ